MIVIVTMISVVRTPTIMAMVASRDTGTMTTLRAMHVMGHIY